MRAGEGLYIGLMSGTSLDGVDAVLADFSAGRPMVRGAAYRAFSPRLRTELLSLQASGGDELHRAAVAANALVDVYVEAVEAILGESGIARSNIAAIGAHGQTVRHRPAEGYTWQINNPSRLAEATGIAVVADFRSRDVAAGGQGAPLVPAFHAALFQDPLQARVVVNIGGIANITSLPALGGVSHAGVPGDRRQAPAGGTVRADRPPAAMVVTGWDTGPGNVLMDAWCERHLQQPYDVDGRWAATGQVDAALLSEMLTETYFAQSPPKSTGRDLFSAEWLDRTLARAARTEPENVQATLLRLTAQSIVSAVARHCPATAEVFVCGGGARNPMLMRTIADCLARERGPSVSASADVRTTDLLGVPANQVESLAFAWLARAMLNGAPGNLPAVTGARGPRILGALYPA